MDVHNLIDMANRIGEFFESMPDHDEALEGIAEHIRRFWEPRMRRAILGALDTQPKHAFREIVYDALVAARVALTPAHT